MIRRLGLYEFVFRICCFLLPGSAFLIGCIGLRALALIHPLSRDYLYLIVTLSLAWIVCSVHLKVTSIETLFFDSNGVRDCLKALAWTYMSGFSALFFYRGASYSRLLLGFSALILIAEVLILRIAFRSIVRRSAKRREQIRIIIVGADAFAQGTSERLQKSAVAPCETVAFVRIPGQKVDVKAGIPVFELEQLASLNIKHYANDLVIAASAEMLPMLSSLIGQLKDLAIPIRFCLDLGPDVTMREQFFRIGRTHMFDVQIAPSETIGYVVLKRSFDIAFSLVALTIAGIPMVLIAIALKMFSAGPVFFVQERVGINGQVFKMLKFRTMKVASVSETDTRWTTHGDSRRTVIGSLLRQSSLDELPQFFNVLGGNMSVVGPRPERPHFVLKFKSEVDSYNCRHHLKSGITGWAQVHGLRGDTDIAKRIDYDLYYVRNWSLMLDIQIILMTVFSGCFAQNHEGDGSIPVSAEAHLQGGTLEGF